MVYQVKVNNSAEKSIKKFHKAVQSRIYNLLVSLGENPRPRGCKKLKGKRNLYRVKCGDYRVIYTIEDDVLLVTIIRVGYRSVSYQNLGRL